MRGHQFSCSDWYRCDAVSMLIASIKQNIGKAVYFNSTVGQYDDAGRRDVLPARREIAFFTFKSLLNSSPPAWFDAFVLTFLFIRDERQDKENRTAAWAPRTWSWNAKEERKVQAPCKTSRWVAVTSRLFDGCLYRCTLSLAILFLSRIKSSLSCTALRDSRRRRRNTIFLLQLLGLRGRIPGRMANFQLTLFEVRSRRSDLTPRW